MAIHKKLPVGSILFTYHEPAYSYYSHRGGREKYQINFYLLYVHNRRERSSGVSVPASITPVLDYLKIRYDSQGYDNTKVAAIGCRAYKYHTVASHLPYPTAEDVQKAQEELQSFMQRPEFTNEGLTIPIVHNEFMEDLKEQKLKNKDCIFSLSKPLQEYIERETYVS